MIKFSSLQPATMKVSTRHLRVPDNQTRVDYILALVYATVIVKMPMFCSAFNIHIQLLGTGPPLDKYVPRPIIYVFNSMQ